MVDVRVDRGWVTGSCGHNIKVKRIPMKLAKQGLQACLDNAGRLVDAARTLFKASRNELAFFMVLTAYEEMAKCHCILEETVRVYDLQEDLLVDACVFEYHPAKYRMTMDYLDDWIATWDSLATAFSTALGEIDTPELSADRKVIHQNGFQIRNECLYVDYEDGWMVGPRIAISRERVEQHLKMIVSMMGGFHNTLRNWPLSVSKREFAAREGTAEFAPFK